MCMYWTDKQENKKTLVSMTTISLVPSSVGCILPLAVVGAEAELSPPEAEALSLSPSEAPVGHLGH